MLSGPPATQGPAAEAAGGEVPVKPGRRASGRRFGFPRVTTAVSIIVLVGVIGLSADLDRA